MKINQSDNHISLNQEYYIQILVSRLEKNSKHQFKVNDTSILNHFVPTKKEYPTTDIENKEVRLRFEQ